MNINSLIATGLSHQQAEAYALILEHGSLRPPQLASLMKLSRTNAYKIADKLIELGLIEKNDSNKKISYRLTNPLAFASISAEYRAQAVSRDEAVKNVLADVLANYYKHTASIHSESVAGNQKVAELYHKQLALKEDVCFIHTKNDVPFMGFDTMHAIRTTPALQGNKRESIMFVNKNRPINTNKETHKRSMMDVTWADDSFYNSPVEWSVTKTSLLIVSYSKIPQAILVIDPIIASSFMQLFSLLQKLLQTQELHKSLLSDTKIN